MKRAVAIIILSLIMIFMAGYQLWDLYRPRVGPIGNGTHALYVYIAIYSGLLAGVCFLVVGVIRLYNIRNRP
jgi:hypothetical protein